MTLRFSANNLCDPLRFYHFNTAEKSISKSKIQTNMTNQTQHSNSPEFQAASVFICECSSTEHQIVVNYDFDDNIVYCHIHLTNQSFWNRLKSGIKYIFGYHCRYGHWDEFIWKPEHATKLRELADLLSKQARNL